MLRFTAFLLLVAIFPRGAGWAAESMLLLEDFDSGAGWSAVGRARVETVADGYRDRCLRMQLGVRDSGPVQTAIVQGPNSAAADAWERGPTDGLNAIVFYARASEPTVIRVVLRVRSRTVAGLAGVQGALQASIAIAGSDWRRYAVRFEDFQGPPALLPVGDALFRNWWPQIQFQMTPLSDSAGAARTVWVDDLAFAAAEKSSGRELPLVYPGRDRSADVSARFAPASVTRIVPSDPGRSVQELRTAWTFVPWENSQGDFGEPVVCPLPHGWPGRRDYSAAWYLWDLEVREAAEQRLVLRLERVAFYAAAFVNGRPVGEHRGGFTPMEFDLTPALAGTRNRLAIYVLDATVAIQGDRAVHQLGVMQPDRLRLTGGILGRAWIETRPKVHVTDLFVKTSTRRKRIEVDCELTNCGDVPAQAELRFAVHEWRTGKPAEVSFPARSVRLEPGQRRTVAMASAWPDPQLWSPERPQLYVLRAELVTESGRDVFERRFGFREFWIDGGQFMLNGTPIRLRGESAFRDHSSVPISLNRAWLRTAMRAWKESFGVNAFRLHASIASQPVLEVADEEGLLLIHQSSIWSAMGGHYHRGGDEFLEHTRQEFAEWVRRDRNHPSVVIWDVENEQLRGSKRDEYSRWVMPLDDFVREHDSTRPIEHSGAGWYEPSADIYHVHMEEHYTKLLELWSHAPDRPLVHGEYWIGGRGEGRLPASRETGSQAEYTAEELRLYHESIVEQRAYGASGVMPFTASNAAFEPLTPHGSVQVAEDLADPDPRPATASSRFNPGWIAGAPPYQLRPQAKRYLYNALGPVTAFYWPRSEAAEARTAAERTIVVCNDSESRQEIHVRWGLDQQAIGQKRFTIAPAGQERFTILAPAPAAGRTGTLFVEAHAENHQTARDELTIRGIESDKLAAPRLRQVPSCTDPEQIVAPRLAQRGVETVACDGVPQLGESRLWIIAPEASNRALDAQAAAIRQYLERGGRILCLAQEQLPKWCPVRLNSWSASRQSPTAFLGFGWQDSWKDIYYARQAPIYAPGHPVFEGLPLQDVRWWNPSDGRVSDDAYARPAATGAVARGNWRPLLGACRRENLSLVEVPVGDGLLILCPAHVVRESETPEARRLLWNLLRYLDRDSVAMPPRTVSAAGARVQEAARLLAGAELPAFDDRDDAHTVIAGPAADANQLVAWATRTGGVAVILSAEVTGSLPGFQVDRNPRHTYMASRGEPHPMFWGLATCSFEDHLRPAVQGEITRYPEGCRVLLRGLSGPRERAVPQVGGIGRSGVIALDACGPAAVEWPVGAGSVIATTLEPFDVQSPHAAEIVSLLLTNAGVRLEPLRKTQPRIRALRTGPLVLDGRLDDWTNDIEDRNVSPFRHAEPVVLGADVLVRGQAAGDQQLSGIVYFLWNDTGLYVAGLAIGTERIAVQIGGQSLNLTRQTSGWQAALEKASIPCRAEEIADVRQFADAKYLTFSEIDDRIGNVRPVRNAVRGRTFELLVPWPALGIPPDAESSFAVEIEGENGALRLPPGPVTEQGILVFAE